MLKKILNQFSTSTYSDSKESDANQINIKSWEGAQEYELNHAIRFMQEDSFKTLFAQFREGVLQLSKGYFAERIKSEFFGGDERLSAHFYLTSLESPAWTLVRAFFLHWPRGTPAKDALLSSRLVGKSNLGKLKILVPRPTMI